MFLDSKYTNIAWGKTKATFVTTHGIGPWVVSRRVLEYHDQHFALHLDESTYNGKLILDFWIVYSSPKENKRISTYLTTQELEAQIDVLPFIMGL